MATFTASAEQVCSCPLGGKRTLAAGLKQSVQGQSNNQPCCERNANRSDRGEGQPNCLAAAATLLEEAIPKEEPNHGRNCKKANHGACDKPNLSTDGPHRGSLTPNVNDRNRSSVCQMEFGGEGGIRTHGGLAPTAVFKTAALNHSATSPFGPAPMLGRACRASHGPSRACADACMWHHGKN